MSMLKTSKLGIKINHSLEMTDNSSSSTNLDSDDNTFINISNNYKSETSEFLGFHDSEQLELDCLSRCLYRTKSKMHTNMKRGSTYANISTGNDSDKSVKRKNKQGITKRVGDCQENSITFKEVKKRHVYAPILFHSPSKKSPNAKCILGIKDVYVESDVEDCDVNSSQKRVDDICNAYTKSTLPDVDFIHKRRDVRTYSKQRRNSFSTSIDVSYNKLGEYDFSKRNSYNSSNSPSRESSCEKDDSNLSTPLVDQSVVNDENLMALNVSSTSSENIPLINFYQKCTSPILKKISKSAAENISKTICRESATPMGTETTPLNNCTKSDELYQKFPLPISCLENLCEARRQYSTSPVTSDTTPLVSSNSEEIKVEELCQECPAPVENSFISLENVVLKQFDDMHMSSNSASTTMETNSGIVESITVNGCFQTCPEVISAINLNNTTNQIGTEKYNAIAMTTDNFKLCTLQSQDGVIYDRDSTLKTPNKLDIESETKSTTSYVDRSSEDSFLKGSCNKLLPPPPFTSMENSNNAIDNTTKIMEKFQEHKSVTIPHFALNELSFNGTLNQFKNNVTEESKQLFQHDVSEIQSLNVAAETIDNATSILAPHSPSLFSSEDESDNEAGADKELMLEEKSHVVTVMDKGKANDLELLKRLQQTLNGVPPPPAITMSQLNMSDMLNLYHKNKHTYEYRNTTRQLQTPSKLKITNAEQEDSNRTPPNLKTWVDVQKINVSINPLNDVMFIKKCNKTKSNLCSYSDDETSKVLIDKSEVGLSRTSLLISSHLIDVLASPWPQVMNCRYHGVLYNRDCVSEEFAILCMKFKERFVGAETQSSFSTSLYSLAQRKILKTRYTQSPGRRLSHLARRRQTFSSANLQAGTNIANTQTNKCSSTTIAKQIMIEAKKPDQRRRFRPVAKTNSNRRTPGKKTPGKKTPSKNNPGTRTPGRRTPGRKTPGRKTPGKGTPSASAKKRAVRRLMIPSASDSQLFSAGPSTSATCASGTGFTRESSKRALFLSPPKRLLAPKHVPVNCKAQRSKRALFPSPNKSSAISNDNLMHLRNDSSCDMKYNVENGTGQHRHISFQTLSAKPMPYFESSTAEERKRKRSACEDEYEDSLTQLSKFPRSLSFCQLGNNTNSGSENSQSGKVVTRRASVNIASGSSGDLNETHRKKLLWAVAEALRSQNISMGNPQFKSFAATLARLTRKLMPGWGQPGASRQHGSTSDRLLRLAKQHAFSVIKGKSIDEIIIAEQLRLARATSSKVTGYVPISEYEENKITALSKRITSQTDSVKMNSTASTTTGFNYNSNSNSGFLNLEYESMDSFGLNRNAFKRSLNNDRTAGKGARRQISFDNCNIPGR